MGFIKKQDGFVLNCVMIIALVLAEGFISHTLAVVIAMLTVIFQLATLLMGVVCNVSMRAWDSVVESGNMNPEAEDCLLKFMKNNFGDERAFKEIIRSEYIWDATFFLVIYGVSMPLAFVHGLLCVASWALMSAAQQYYAHEFIEQEAK